MTLPRSKCQSSFCELAVPRVFSAGPIPLFPDGHKNRIALAPAFAHNPPMLARVLSAAFNDPVGLRCRAAQMFAGVLPAAVNGMEGFLVEAQAHSGWGDANLVIAGPPNAAVKESRDRAKGWEL